VIDIYFLRLCAMLLSLHGAMSSFVLFVHIQNPEANQHGANNESHVSVIGKTIKLFGLRNDLIYRLLTPHFFVWFVEWIELIHHHLIPYNYLVSTNMRNKVIPPNLRNGPMMHHYILDEVIPQTKHPLYIFSGSDVIWFTVLTSLAR
jgi:hypothetical protein